jgi:hypothetical protein
MDSRCPSAGGLRFLDHPIPTEELGVPHGSLTGRAVYRAALLPDLIGVATFRTDELRPGWVPSLHRGRGVRGGHVDIDHSLARMLYISLSCPVFSPSRSAILRRFAVTMVRRGFTRVHPSGLPLACGSLMAGRPWASAPPLHTPPLPAAHGRVGTGIGHLPESSLSSRPLIRCDLVSHVYPTLTSGFCPVLRHFRVLCPIS